MTVASSIRIFFEAGGIEEMKEMVKWKVGEISRKSDAEGIFYSRMWHK